MTDTTSTPPTEADSYKVTRFNALRHGVLSRYTVFDSPMGPGSPLAPIMGYPVPDARQAAKVRSKPSGGGLG